MALLLPRNKTIGLFSLVMISVIAVDSLRSLSIGAEYGLGLIFFYSIIALVFFIPNIVISAELATGWPNTGGAYIWIREAFGIKWGFFAIWLQWIYNLAWFPVIFAFIGAVLATLIHPSLVYHKFYMLGTVLTLLWLSTLVSCFGIRIASWISIVGAMLGTIFPMLVIIILGIFWCLSGKPVQIDFSINAFIPDLSHIDKLVLLSSIIFGLMGIEISAVHAGNVERPDKNYPKALGYAGLMIFLSLVLASLAISLVIPQQQISLVSGLMDAFRLFFNAFHMPWASNIIALLIILGSLAGVSAWILGPARSLLVACQDMHFSEFFQKTNQQEMPVRILILQAVIVSLLSSIFLLMPTVNSAYWIMSALTVQLALPYYILLFASGIRLRYKKALVKRAYRVPVGNVGIWLCGILGIVSCVFAIAVGFLPPSQVSVGKIWRYELILVSGILFFCIFPFVLYRFRHRLNG